jgi:hypothetical protein
VEILLNSLEDVETEDLNSPRTADFEVPKVATADSEKARRAGLPIAFDRCLQKGITLCPSLRDPSPQWRRVATRQPRNVSFNIEIALVLEKFPRLQARDLPLLANMLSPKSEAP